MSVPAVRAEGTHGGGQHGEDEKDLHRLRPAGLLGVLVPSDDELEGHVESHCRQQRVGEVKANPRVVPAYENDEVRDHIAARHEGREDHGDERADRRAKLLSDFLLGCVCVLLHNVRQGTLQGGDEGHHGEGGEVGRNLCHLEPWRAEDCWWPVVSKKKGKGTREERGVLTGRQEDGGWGCRVSLWCWVQAYTYVGRVGEEGQGLLGGCWVCSSRRLQYLAELETSEAEAA